MDCNISCLFMYRIKWHTSDPGLLWEYQFKAADWHVCPRRPASGYETYFINHQTAGSHRPPVWGWLVASSSFLTIDSVDTRIWGIWDCRYLVVLCQSEGHHTAGGDSGVKYRRGDTHANALWPNAHSWVSRHGQNTIMYWKWTLQSVSIHVFTDMRMLRHGVWWPSGARLRDL